MATAAMDRRAHFSDLDKSLITTRIWRPGEAPEVLDLSEAEPGEGVLHFEVITGADPLAVYHALRPVCGSELTLPMVEDLVQPDDMPQIKLQEDERISAVSGFAVEASDGRLVFNVVEFLANDRWLITCSHRASSYAGTGPAKPSDSPASCSLLIRDVARRWTADRWDNASDLGVLFLHALTCSYSVAVRELMNRLDQWERTFYVESDVDQHLLKDLRGLASEFRARLNGVNVPRDEADSAWFSNVTNTLIAERADWQIDKALEGLDRLGDMLRGALALVQAQQSEQLQRKVELVTVVFLVPTLVAGIWGENTWVPGHNEPWGFGLTIVTMVVGALLARALMRSLGRRKAGAL